MRMYAYRYSQQKEHKGTHANNLTLAGRNGQTRTKVNLEGGAGLHCGNSCCRVFA